GGRVCLFGIELPAEAPAVVRRRVGESTARDEPLGAAGQLLDRAAVAVLVPRLASAAGGDERGAGAEREPAASGRDESEERGRLRRAPPCSSHGGTMSGQRAPV